MKAKRFIAALAALVFVLAVASPALAASLGISPSHTELEVPSDSSATADFKVHYFSGDLKISLVDIPLRVEPETIHIEPSDEPTNIELTIYGDESLGSWIYDGYVRFLGMSGGTVAVAVEVKAKVTNLVEGETPVLATPEESQPPPEEAAVEEAPPEEAVVEEAPPAEESPAALEEAAQTPPGPPGPPAAQGTTEVRGLAGIAEWPILQLAGIIAGTAVVITVIVVFARRRVRY